MIGAMSDAANDAQEELLKFPHDFNLKVVGLNSATFEALVVSIVSPFVPADDLGTCHLRSSTGEKYLAVTLNFTARSREQLDKIYRALSSHEAVTMVL